MPGSVRTFCEDCDSQGTNKLQDKERTLDKVSDTLSFLWKSSVNQFEAIQTNFAEVAILAGIERSIFDGTPQSDFISHIVLRDTCTKLSCIRDALFKRHVVFLHRDQRH